MNQFETVANSDGKVKAISVKGSLTAGLLAGLAASACCAGPFVLLMLGVSGSWISNFSMLEPYRPIFIVIAVVFLILAYRRIYGKAQSCGTQSHKIKAICATTQGRRTQRLAFWIIAALMTLSISFPWYGPLLFD